MKHFPGFIEMCVNSTEIVENTFNWAVAKKYYSGLCDVVFFMLLPLLY